MSRANLAAILCVGILYLFPSKCELNSITRFHKGTITADVSNRSTASFSADSIESAYAFLHRSITNLLASANLRSTRYSIAVYSLDHNTMVFERALDLQLTPASLTKLFYTVAAFATMGSNYSIQTVVATDSTLRNGVVDGNVYLIGRGDCLLTTRNYETLAEQLRQQGIKHIRGSIIADASYFDQLTDRQAYSGDKERMEDLPPITALGVDGNTFTVVVSRGTGSKVRIQTLPSSDAVRVEHGRIPTVQQTNPQRRSHHRFRRNQRYRGVHVQPLRASSSLRNDGIQEIRIVGLPRPNSSVSFRLHMLNPPLVAAGVLKRCLEAEGIRVDGSIRVENVSKSVRYLAVHESPLRAFVELCNKNSDNFIAEHIMKIVGAFCCGNEQCNVNAFRTVSALLDSMGIPSDCCILHDGSGLSRRNRITTAALLTLIRYCLRQPWAEDFLQTLSIAGRDGTLKNRMRATAAEGNLHGKTGTHRNVSGLCGVVHSARGERFALIALWNGNAVSMYKRLENQLAELVASFGSESETIPTRGETSESR